MREQCQTVTYSNKLGLQEGVLQICRSQERDRKGDERVLVSIVESVGIISREEFIVLDDIVEEELGLHAEIQRCILGKGKSAVSSQGSRRAHEIWT